ncbi:MAG: hypothetical protein IT273_14020 [Chitinophagales bacterium]|nr:hypothetical protein [Chitinophagales bacterium]
MDIFNNQPPPAQLNISTKSAIVLQLARYAEANNDTAQEANQYLEIIDREVSDIKATWYGRSRYNIKLDVVLNDNDKSVADSVEQALHSPLLAQAIRIVLNLPPEKADKPLKLDITLRSKKGTFRVSGHYIDQKLKQTKGDSLERLFDTLSPQVRDSIQGIKVLVQGIRLDPFEDRVLNAIIKLLNLKSGKDLQGNLPAVQNLYGGTMTSYPKLRIAPHELYTEVSGTKNYSGKEIQNIKAVLMRLQDKKYLIMYQRHRKEMRGGKVTEVVDVIQEYQSLFRIISYYEGLTKTELSLLADDESEVASTKGEAIFLLNPVFVDQIDTKFIEYPEDVNLQTSIAMGGPHKLTPAMTQLRDYMMRLISTSKHPYKHKHCIDKNTLVELLGLSEIAKEGRAKRVKNRIDEAIELCYKMSLISAHKEILGKKGQAQIEFTLNLGKEPNT